MYKGERVAVVIPAYNEQKLIVPTLENVPKYFDRIYVINDGSRDRTAAVVKQKGRHDRRIKLIQHTRNMGLGQAIITGYKAAAEDQNDIIFVVGGDFQMDLGEAEKFLEPLVNDQADFVKGNRFLYDSNISSTMPNMRLFGNSMLSFLTKLASGYWKVFDSNDGYTAVRRWVIEKVDWDKATKGYGYNGDWQTMFNLLNVRIKDIPRRPIYLKGERQSQIRIWKYIPKVLPRLIYRFFWRINRKYLLADFNPLVLFYYMGIVLIPLGLAVGFYLLYAKLTTGVVAGSTTVLCALFLLMGLQSFFFAIEQDMRDNEKLS